MPGHPHAILAHCFQHNDIYVYAQLLSTVVKISVLHVGHRYTANSLFSFFLFFLIAFLFIFPAFFLVGTFSKKKTKSLDPKGRTPLFRRLTCFCQWPTAADKCVHSGWGLAPLR